MSQPSQTNTRTIVLFAVVGVLAIPLLLNIFGGSDVNEGALLEQVKSPDTKTAAKAMTTLSYTDADEHAEVFQEKLTAPSPEVRVAAVVALSRTNVKRKEVMPVVIETMKEEKVPEVREAGMRAVGTQLHAADGGIELLFAGLNDTDKDVRVTAHKELKKLLKAEYPYDADAPEKDRLAITEKYRKLWEWTNQNYDFEIYRDRLKQAEKNAKRQAN